MRTSLWILAAAAALCLGAWGEEYTIPHHGNGEISWTNDFPDAAYRVEWSTSADGSWTNEASFLNPIAATGSVVTVDVPMYFRVNVLTSAPSGMVLIPGGSFTMGDAYAEGETNELPLHSVYVSPFYIEVYEVTKSLWEDVYTWATNNGYTFDNTGTGQETNHPVVAINWYDCIKWCNARSEMETLTPAYYEDPVFSTVYRTGQVNVLHRHVDWDADGYRLPTEAEWEKAARGGLVTNHFPWASSGGSWSNHLDGSKANYYESGDSYEGGGSPETTPVGMYAANGYGLYDMAGNVQEWCWDWYDGSWYSSADATNNDTPGPATGMFKPLRGGSWGWMWGYYLTCSFRADGWGVPYYAESDTGFRCVRYP